MKNHLGRNHKGVAPFTKCSKEVTKFFKNLLSDRKTQIDAHVKDNDDIQAVASQNTINAMLKKKTEKMHV